MSSKDNISVRELVKDAKVWRKELDEARDEDDDELTDTHRSNSTRGRTQKIIGSSAILSGSALLAYKYSSQLKKYATTETAGFTLLASGIAALIQPSLSKLSWNKRQEKMAKDTGPYLLSELDRLETMDFVDTSLRASCFKFTLLNYRFVKDRFRLLQDLHVPMENVHVPESVKAEWTRAKEVSAAKEKEVAKQRLSDLEALVATPPHQMVADHPVLGQGENDIQSKSSSGESVHAPAAAPSKCPVGEESRKSGMQRAVGSTSADAEPAFAYERLNRRVFVVDFNSSPSARSQTISRKRDGEFAASDIDDVVEDFCDSIDFLSKVATPMDEVVVRLNSPGGPVAPFGLAASQILRLREAGVLTVACVDSMACSGGYMVAAACQRIVAAPFSLVGSIGVVMELPNFARAMEYGRLDYLVYTSGKHKRTVHPFLPPTPEDQAQVEKELEEVHVEFKQHVLEGRKAGETQESSVSMEEVATGQAWLARQAKGMGLVDDLLTSDEYLRSKEDRFDVIHVQRHHRGRVKASSLWALLVDGLLNEVGLNASRLSGFLSTWIKAAWGPLARVGIPPLKARVNARDPRFRANL